MIALAAVALALAPGPARGTGFAVDDLGRLAWARVALAGPAESITIEVPGGGVTEVDVSLPTGGARTLVVPVPIPAAASAALVRSLRPRVQPAERGRFEAWDEGRLAEMERAVAGWPYELRRRARPSPPGAGDARERRPPPLAPWCLAGFLALALGSGRRRPLVLFGLGAGAAAVLVAATTLAEVRAGGARILEGDGGTGTWISVRVAPGELASQTSGLVRVETRPAEAPLTVRFDPDRSGTVELAVASGEVIAIHRVEDAPAIRPANNGWSALEPLWIRDGSGAWTRRGRWGPGDVEPEPLEEGRASPPGWLNPALPLGRPILVGRTADGGPEEVPLWVRLVGLGETPAGD